MRQAAIADLPAMHSAATEFYASSQFLETFDLARFTGVWTELLAGGAGVIFVQGDADVDGALGGVVHRDLYSDELMASEFFWFVKAGKRGAGISLYREFEKWARDKGCRRIEMVHLLDVMPEKVARFYRTLGYRAAETRYTKQLKGEA